MAMSVDFCPDLRSSYAELWVEGKGQPDPVKQGSYWLWWWWVDIREKFLDERGHAQCLYRSSDTKIAHTTSDPELKRQIQCFECFQAMRGGLCTVQCQSAIDCRDPLAQPNRATGRLPALVWNLQFFTASLFTSSESPLGIG